MDDASGTGSEIDAEQPVVEGGEPVGCPFPLILYGLYILHQLAMREKKALRQQDLDAAFAFFANTTAQAPGAWPKGTAVVRSSLGQDSRPPGTPGKILGSLAGETTIGYFVLFDGDHRPTSCSAEELLPASIARPCEPEP